MGSLRSGISWGEGVGFSGTGWGTLGGVIPATFQSISSTAARRELEVPKYSEILSMLNLLQ